MKKHTKYTIFYQDDNGENYMKNRPYYEKLQEQGVGSIDNFGVYEVFLATVLLPESTNHDNLDTIINHLNSSYKFDFIYVGIDDEIDLWVYRYENGKYDAYSEKGEL